MKIVDVEVFLLHAGVAPGPRTGPFILVKLTSDDGVTGWGQAIHRGGDLTVSALVTLGGWLKERDVVSIEGVWQQFFQRGSGRGTTGVEMAALSAIDIALHDLFGHTLGVSVATLLGGSVRDKIPVYASFMSPPLEPALEVERVAATVERGFKAVKLHAGNPRFKGEDGPTFAIRVCEAVREIWPSRWDLQLIIDVNNTFTVHEAIRVGRVLEELDVWWLEEPISANDLIGYKKVQAALDLPVSAGEGECNLAQFRDLILLADLDILQPNLTTCGGFTMGKKIASLAEAFNRPIACHNVDPALTTAVHMQFASWAQTATLPQEYFALDDFHPLREGTPILSKAIVPDDDGFVTLPDAPGLGVEVDEERVRSIALTTSA
jgi:L-alanine-DL-glutamate epimerase-like enolase superfamily enzyme